MVYFRYNPSIAQPLIHGSQMSKIMSYFSDMDKIAQNRVKKKNIKPDSRLNQGTSWWWPPYTFSEMLEYTQGFFSAGRSSKQNPNALVGKNTPTHVVGLKKAELKHHIKCDHQPESFLVVGDVLLSKNGKSIILGSQLKEKIRNSKVMIFNVESPVTSDTKEKGRSSILNIVINGFKFSLRIPESYLRALIEEIKSANPEIEIIYDIANNHTLDDTTLNYDQMDPAEQAFYNLDKSNFPVYRTIYGIRKIDPKAQIIGAWTNELEFKAFPTPVGKINLHTEPVAQIKLNGMSCGFMALTDILNNNYTHWETGRVMRPEDIEDILAEIKSHYKLDKLFLLIHGGVEQNLYPSEHWAKFT